MAPAVLERRRDDFGAGRVALVLREHRGLVVLDVVEALPDERMILRGFRPGVLHVLPELRAGTVDPRVQVRPEAVYGLD